MPALTIIGAQWGDEGKGKVVDFVTARADMVVRFQGGNNAGHTLVVDGAKTTLSLIPSGALRPQTKCLIGAGTVLNASVLVAEMEKLSALGIDLSPSRLIVDRDAHLVLDYHVAIDQERERSGLYPRIGTTGRGIGPAYEDRASRLGIRCAELLYPERLRERVFQQAKECNQYLSGVLGSSRRVDVESIWQELSDAAARLQPFVGNGSLLVDESLQRGEKVVFEGAQGVLLDAVHGTYPYVTSSSTIAGAVCTGVGIGPKSVGTVLGIAKAYATRVGEGPFPSEMGEEMSVDIRTRGHEFGSVTGRPRRCGWFDVPAMRRAIRISGIDAIGLTKLDVLTGLKSIKVCVGYTRGGVVLDDLPALAHEFADLVPEWREFPGWDDDIRGIRKHSDLPRKVREFVTGISKLCDRPIVLTSVAPDREATLPLDNNGLLDSFVEKSG